VLLNDPVLGCPCNGTWALATERQITTAAIPVGTQLPAGFAPQLCPPGTCPLGFWFSQAPTFGTIELSNWTTTVNMNGTMGELHVKISSTSTDAAVGGSITDTTFEIKNTGQPCLLSVNPSAAATPIPSAKVSSSSARATFNFIATAALFFTLLAIW
jgi:hypothetical protein